MRAAFCAALMLPALTLAQGLELERGHIKLRGQLTQLEDDSIYRDFVGTPAHDLGSAIRLNTRADFGAWSFTAHYQLLAVQGSRVELNRALPDPALAQPVLPLDSLRWMNLSDTLHEGSDSEAVQRLDRLHLDWSNDKTVLRLGRQAVSWGNGLFYNPMDFFNPFDPSAIDTEYKLGDDMLYGQRLLDSGSDWQAVAVQRRDPQGNASAQARSYALKYHGFSATREFDLLLAEHFEQTMFGVGGSTNLGDAILRGDLVLTDGIDGWTASAVLNSSWSWVTRGHNMSGSIEYFFNGFGLRESDYGEAGFLSSPDLVARIRRGELFSVGRHYLAASVGIEMHPLIQLTPSLFYNLGDSSALGQLSINWDLADNWQLIGAANIPIGPTGTEFGGLSLTIGEELRTLGTGASVLLQIAWYF